MECKRRVVVCSAHEPSNRGVSQEISWRGIVIWKGTNVQVSRGRGKSEKNLR